MAQTLITVTVSTKSGDPSLSLGILHAYLGGIIKGMNGVPEMVGGVEDHVHILASLRPVHCIADVLRDLRKEASTWAKENYAAFTVSPTATDSVRRYIATQEAHHRKHSC